MTQHHDLPSYLAHLRAQGVTRIADSVARGLHETLLPAGGQDWVDGEPASEPLLELDFEAWPSGACLALEHELQERNVEHLWRGRHLLVPSRLETTVDDLLDELADASGAGPAPGADTLDSTRWCPSCGGEFIEGVGSCPDCGVALEARPARPAVTGAGPTAHFDLSAWTEEARLFLAHELAGRFPPFDRGVTSAAPAVGTFYHVYGSLPAVPHAWDGTTLVVREIDAERVGVSVAAAEVAFTLGLDLDADKVAYEVEDMSDEALTQLLVTLVDRRICHELTADGELFVHETDEALVEEILDGIDFPDQLEAEDDGLLADPDDGLTAQEVLSELFEAADRLHHDTHNADAVLQLVRAAERRASLPLPFGFARPDWDALGDQVDELVRAVEDDAPDPDAVGASARALRVALHPLV